jgi:hypothetical protein
VTLADRAAELRDDLAAMGYGGLVEWLLAQGLDLEG